MTPQQARNAKFEAIFKAGKINVRRVKALGPFVHIDTFEKYADQIGHVMSGAGFKLMAQSNGRHMDSVDGFRMVFTVAS